MRGQRIFTAPPDLNDPFIIRKGTVGRIRPAFQLFIKDPSVHLDLLKFHTDLERRNFTTFQRWDLCVLNPIDLEYERNHVLFTMVL